MPDSINRTDLQAFRDHVETHRSDILDIGLRGAPSLARLFPFPGVTGKLILEWAEIERIVKRWACDFTPDPDTIRRRPVIIENAFHKAEMSVCPKKDFFTYKGYLVKTKQKAKDYPFAKWAMMKASKMIAHQIEFDQMWTGVENAGADDAVDMYDGILTSINNDQASGTPVLAPVATGPLTPATVIDQLRQIADAVDEEYLSTGTWQMWVSPASFKMYIRQRQAVSGFHPNDGYAAIKSGEVDLDGVDANIKLVSAPGMRNSDRILLTPEDNLYYAYDDSKDANVWEFEQDHRNLDMWCDYWHGVGILILDPRIVIINDQQ